MRKSLHDKSPTETGSGEAAQALAGVGAGRIQRDRAGEVGAGGGGVRFDAGEGAVDQGVDVVGTQRQYAIVFGGRVGEAAGQLRAGAQAEARGDLFVGGEAAAVESARAGVEGAVGGAFVVEGGGEA